jgi:hypothetical protein
MEEENKTLYCISSECTNTGAELLIYTESYKIIDKKDMDIKYEKFDKLTFK